MNVEWLELEVSIYFIASIEFEEEEKSDEQELSKSPSDCSD